MTASPPARPPGPDSLGPDAPAPDRHNRRIRRARATDAPAMAALAQAAVHAHGPARYGAAHVAAWAAHMDTAWFQRALDTAEPFWVATDDEGIAGLASLRSTEIGLVYTHPRAARQGVASALLQVVEETAGARGLATLEVVAGLTSRAFFERHGYRYLRPDPGTVAGLVYERARLTKRLA